DRTRSILLGLLASSLALSDPEAIRAADTRALYVADGAALYRVDRTTGDRTIVSSVDVTYGCYAAGLPYACCTGAGTGNGTHPCKPGVGSGPTAGDFTFASLAIQGTNLYSGFDTFLLRVNPSTGDRTLVSATNGVAGCWGAGKPYVCCTGEGTGDGTFPCTA